jgi:Domain of Unknown Function with PDB structure (DUF3857)
MRYSNFARSLSLGAFILFSVLACAEEGHPWLPVDAKDLQMKEFKQLPGAEAVLLYYSHEMDDVSHIDFFYSRIKILTDGGKQYANLEIPLGEKTSVADLFARTIHPDGKIVELTDHPFEKMVFRGKGVRVRVQATTLPEVSVGDIIEYRYELRYGDKGVHQHQWTVQHDLYTVKEHFLFRYDKKFSVKWLPSLGLNQSPDHDQKAGVLKMDSENIAPFEAEEQMPPVDGYKLQVKFFYTSPFMSSPSAFWFETGQWWSRGIDYFIGTHKEFVAAAQEAIGSETDPEKKLRKLYARAQEIRNLTYERQRTEKEQKKEELKDNKTAVDILRHGYGDRNDITRFFVALARGGGFTSSVIFVSSRESRLFEKEIMSFGQLDSEIALVRLNGKYVYLDPGTRFCPYGLLRWTRTGTAAMDMSNPGDIFTTPGAGADSSFVARSAELKLSPDGAAKGEVRIEFSGAEALEWRLSSLSTDEAGRKKELEDELKLWLPANAKVEMTDSVAWDKEYEPLTAVFQVEVPEFASAAGKRLLIPTALFLSKNKRVLKSGPRKYPIYYHYAFTEVDAVSLQLPEGYSAETLAAPQKVNTNFGKYSSNAGITGKYVNLERSLRFGGVMFPPDKYDELRNFFTKVQTGDELQTVLHQAAPAEDHHAN